MNDLCWVTVLFLWVLDRVVQKYLFSLFGDLCGIRTKRDGLPSSSRSHSCTSSEFPTAAVLLLPG